MNQFFFEKEDFLKNGYGYDFETFTNGFLVKNCIRISRHLRTKFFPPKLEIGDTVPENVNIFKYVCNDRKGLKNLIFQLRTTTRYIADLFF